MAEQSEMFEEPLPLTDTSRTNRGGRGGRPLIIVADENHIDNIELSEDL